MPKVLILAEKRDKDIHPITLELIEAGLKLIQEQGGHIDVALLGHEVSSLAEGLLYKRVNTVYLVESPFLADYTTDAFVNTMRHVISLSDPEFLLMGQTAIGRDLAPRLAFRVNTAVAMDCINLELDELTGTLIAMRPNYGGSILATYKFGQDLRPQIVTIRSRAFKAAESIPEPIGQIRPVTVDMNSSQIRTAIVGRESLLKEGEPRVEDAAIIVSGGRGIGSKDDYRSIENMANVIGGVPAASRPLVDMEWVDPSRQVGLTGKVVAPDIYIAVAISGAMHHMAGCANSKVIVAVNNDPKAPIFKYAKYGIVGDCGEIVPALIDELRKSSAG